MHDHGRTARCTAALTIVLAGNVPAKAESTTTAMVGDVASFLIDRATCRDFIAAVTVSDRSRTTAETLLVLLATAYMEGHAAGAWSHGLSQEPGFIDRCIRHPDQRFHAQPTLP